jgi:hypothetical protein
MIKGKKSQTEILGVMVIVIIIVIAGIFMLAMSNKKKELPSSSYIDPELAQSFLNALLDTKTKKSLTVSKIISACYENTHHFCGQTTTSDCCSYAESVIRNALSATLGEWGKSYRLTIKRGDEIKIPTEPGLDAISNDVTCDELAEKEQPGKRTLPKLIEIQLEICK